MERPKDGMRLKGKDSALLLVRWSETLLLRWEVARLEWVITSVRGSSRRKNPLLQWWIGEPDKLRKRVPFLWPGSKNPPLILTGVPCPCFSITLPFSSSCWNHEFPALLKRRGKRREIQMCALGYFSLSVPISLSNAWGRGLRPRDTMGGFHLRCPAAQNIKHFS